MFLINQHDQINIYHQVDQALSSWCSLESYYNPHQMVEAQILKISLVVEIILFLFFMLRLK